MNSLADTEPEMARVLDEYCRRNALLSSVQLEGGQFVEHIYQVKFFRKSDRTKILDALRERLEAHDTRLMLQDSSAEY